MKPRFCWRPQDVGDEMPESWDTCQGELLTECGTSSRERSVLQSTKQKRFGDQKSVLTSDIEMQSGVCPAEFWSYTGPVFPHYFAFPPVWNGNV
ncbi:hypothetical protein H671_xg19925 [Cricetulus griseus]|uniref:Uncharacterized protein n=1 Tax=Cricetulus griseus TaxID=10029 RepID=A0A061HYM4_CRIGR|nr:hypothetical protein H671_xg19925 [Cricetulus griseus]